MTNQYEYKTYGKAIVLEGDVSESEYKQISQRYTSALAQSMASTREALAGSILSEAFGGSHRPWEEEVNFD